MKIKFTKMQGAGNDYIYVNGLSHDLEDPSNAAKKLADRHFGVGGDGLVLILPSQTSDFKMRMFNQDGSEAEMCGNAIRCVGKFLYDQGLTDKQTLTIETLAGEKTLNLILKNNRVSRVRVDMGVPTWEEGTAPIEVGGRSFDVIRVSMGNPHAVIFVDAITDEQVHVLGPEIERHAAFPRKTNVEFARVINKKEMEMRVWERGTGETLACGTGACAVGVAGALMGLTERKTRIHLLGGELNIHWAQDNHVYKTGPAEFVFTGEVEW